jgi:predicted acylesterase/phospholipase RssA
MKKCDIVMKGGITSGIVYPGAVCELADEYQFANIGGTSAGAIAAALTAAAEYRRQNGGGREGFDRIAGLPRWLAETSDGLPRLLKLFQPDSTTSSLHRLMLAILESKGNWQRGIVTIVPELLRASGLAGAVVAVSVILISILAVMTAALEQGLLTALAFFVTLVVAVILAALVIVVAACDVIRNALRDLPRNGFGVCSGRTESGGSTAGLTDWLADEIDRVAGRDPALPPLTFGDLWSVAGGDRKQRTINLEMMTTNLTHGRPYRLPARNRRFYFTREDMRRLFPDRVVNGMIAHSRTSSLPQERRYRTTSGQELFDLPAPESLPVVVATRMSLSFPLLLSAVPLYAVDYGRRDRNRTPELCWFSDGGITSNFPVHFFDAPLPRWPTFAFNLAGWSTRYHTDQQRTYVPRTNSGGILEWWNVFDGLPAFLWSIVTTMQNWRDNMLLRMPGQRDRIAHVLLMPHEGGLNLSMSPQTIREVADRGAAAASGLRERFSNDPPDGVTLTWRNHKWVRFRSFMHALEGAMESATRAFDDRSEPPSFRELLDGPQPSYEVDDESLAAMRATTARFMEQMRECFGNRPFRTPRRRPKPPYALRAMPME